jgi:hypothetical protein
MALLGEEPHPLDDGIDYNTLKDHALVNVAVGKLVVSVQRRDDASRRLPVNGLTVLLRALSRGVLLADVVRSSCYHALASHRPSSRR